MVGRATLLASIAGAATVHQLAQLPAPVYLWWVLGSALVLLAGAWALKRCFCGLSMARQLSLVAVCMALGAMIGFAQTALRAHDRLDDALACQHRGHVLRVSVQVSSIVTGTDLARRFDVLVRDEGAPSGLPARIRVTWRAPFGSTVPVAEVLPGQVWRMALVLRAPRGNINPYGPDIEARVFGQNIRAQGSVRGQPRLLADKPWSSWTTATARVRQGIREAMRTVLTDVSMSPVIIALALGDQSGISRADWMLFSRAGIAHLVAISGLHVGLVAGLAAWLIRRSYGVFRFRGRRLAETVPVQIIMAGAALIAAACYCSLAGWGIPARRVFVMLLVVAGAALMRLSLSGSRVLVAAGAVVVMVDPWAPVAMGFWMSFAAVGALLMLAAVRPVRTDSAHADSISGGDQEVVRWRDACAAWFAAHASKSSRDQARRSSASDDLFESQPSPPTLGGLLQLTLVIGTQRVRRGFLTAARLQLVLTLALAPLLAVFIGQVSLVSPVVNALAIPLVGLLVTPVALLCAACAGLGAATGTAFLAWLAHVFGVLADTILVFTLDVARFLAAPDWAVWEVAAAPWYWALLACAGVIWGLMPPGAPYRRLAWLAMLPLLTWRQSQLPEGAWDLVALDVGQASAIAVLTRNSVVVFDAGLRYDSGDDAGTRNVVPFLRAMGRTHVDHLVVSHRHLDHVGGVRGVLAGVTVGRIHAPFDINAHLRQEAAQFYGGAPVRGWPATASRCAAGVTWQIDGVSFRFVHPPPGVRYTQAQANASSCVLVVQGAHHAAVLPGDIGMQQERPIAREIGKADLVLMPHHGSATSSSPDWISALGATHVIAQAGYANRFRHPSAQASHRWLQAGAWLWRTDLDGAVWASSRQAGLVVKAWRDHVWRYWHEPLGEHAEDRCATIAG